MSNGDEVFKVKGQRVRSPRTCSHRKDSELGGDRGFGRRRTWSWCSSGDTVGQGEGTVGQEGSTGGHRAGEARSGCIQDLV